MTITIRKSTAVLAILIVGILGGLAIGQITAAHSYTDPNTQQLKKIAKEAHKIRVAIGAPVLANVNDLLSDIKKNTGYTCEAVSPPYYSCEPYSVRQTK